MHSNCILNKKQETKQQFIVQLILNVTSDVLYLRNQACELLLKRNKSELFTLLWLDVETGQRERERERERAKLDRKTKSLRA